MQVDDIPIEQATPDPGTPQIEVLTGWYKPVWKPQHVGEYEITTDPRIMPIKKAHWNGVIWCDGDTGKPFVIQEWHWRGLAEPPED